MVGSAGSMAADSDECLFVRKIRLSLTLSTHNIAIIMANEAEYKLEHVAAAVVASDEIDGTFRSNSIGMCTRSLIQRTVALFTAPFCCNCICISVLCLLRETLGAVLSGV